jgi:hypothetical protein
MLNGKMYVIWKLSLIQAGLCSNYLSFKPFVLEFAQPFMGMSDEQFARVNGTPDEQPFVRKFVIAIQGAMGREHVHPMNAAALNYYVADELNAIGGSHGREALEVPNLYFWLRRLMSIATAEALYGPENPLCKNENLVDDFW